MNHRGLRSKCEGEESESKKSGGDFTAELPIEHQIYEMVNEAGSRGVVVFKVAERLGIDRKENRKRIESLCSKFGMIVDKEKCRKTQVYRVWAPGKRNAESANEILNESECVGRSKFTEDVLDGSVQKGDTAMATATNDVSSGMPPAAECARPRRGKGELEPSQVLVPIHFHDHLILSSFSVCVSWLGRYKYNKASLVLTAYIILHYRL